MNEFSAFVVRKENGVVKAGIEPLRMADLPSGDVLIQVRYSSLNYKDALAASGNTGVARRFPHVPGIDAAGVVAESGSTEFAIGDEVLVTGYELGSGQWGGWSEFIRVPAAWIVRRPERLSLFETMALGTAGFTAAQCVLSLEQHGVRPESGEVVVTGATGGVGILAVRLLAQLGHRVVAATGKRDWESRLLELGAARVVGREELQNATPRPLLTARWAGAVDTVGGQTLATLVRELQHRGCVAACGLVGGTDLPLSVFPFLLRGVTLAGIDSAQCPREPRLEIWRRLAGPWRIDKLAELATTIPLPQVAEQVAKMLRGEVAGRVVVSLPPSDHNRPLS